MSIQAVGWALEQSLPARPKLVLVSIANHANHADGYCWLNAETIAAESSHSARSVFRTIAALVRNGYLRKQRRKGADGKQRANDYWILFNRESAQWHWLKGETDDQDDAETHDSDEPEPLDVDAPAAAEKHALAYGPHDSTGTNEASNEQATSYGPSAIGVSAKDSAEPSKTKPQESALPRGTPPRGYRPPPADPPQPMGSTVEGNRGLLFVRFATPAYDAWAKVKAAEKGMSSWSLTTSHEGHRGWFFPTLFPPQTKTEPIPEAIDPPYRQPIAKTG